MAVRHSLLAAGGIAVVLAAVYLAIEVRATPAAAQVTSRAPAPTTAPATAPTSGVATERPAAEPTRSAGIRVGIPTPAKISRTADPSAGGTPATAAPAKLDKPAVEQLVTDAYSAYDRQDFEDAKTHAASVLAQDPKNVRALRIMVSTACIDGSPTEAQKYFDQLPEGKDRADMRTRCGRDYNITFK